MTNTLQTLAEEYGGLVTIRGLLLLGCAVCFCGSFVQAGQIPVNFVGGEIPTGPGSTFTIPAPLPVLLGGNADIGISNFAGDTLFLKFKIPDTSQLSSIDLFTISVTVYDDEVDAGESADIAFALPSTNIFLASPAFTTVNGKTAGSPLTLTYSLTAAQISQVIPTITDGNFRVRIMRDTGDFEVAGGTAVIDATDTPEPSSALLLAVGIYGIAGVRRLRKLRTAQTQK